MRERERSSERQLHVERDRKRSIHFSIHTFSTGQHKATEQRANFRHIRLHAGNEQSWYKDFFLNNEKVGEKDLNSALFTPIVSYIAVGRSRVNRKRQKLDSSSCRYRRRRRMGNYLL